MSEKKPLGALQGCSQRGTGGGGASSRGVGVVGEHSWWYTATPLQVQVLITLTKHDIKSKRNLELNTRFLMMGKYQLVSLIKAEKLWLKPACATHLPTNSFALCVICSTSQQPKTAAAQLQTQISAKFGAACLHLTKQQKYKCMKRQRSGIDSIFQTKLHLRGWRLAWSLNVRRDKRGMQTHRPTSASRSR